MHHPHILLVLIALATAPLAQAQQSGDLDSTFNADGIVTTDFGGGVGGDHGFGMVVQPDGKIIVCGTSFYNSHPTVSMARYTTDGELDTSFGTDGLVFTVPDAGAEEAYAVALQPDGRIVLAGWGGGSMVVLRYHANGTLDSSFAGDGIAFTDIGPGTERVWAVAIQPDGRIVVAGTAGLGVDMDMAVLRYQPDGTLDPTFSDDGIWTYDQSTASEELCALVLQPDGRIVVGGKAPGMSSGFVVARLNADGTLDTDFGTDGFASTGPGRVNGLVLQPDGRIVAVGELSAPAQLKVARFEADGSVDASFATGGVLAFTGTEYSWGRAVALMPDGRIVSAGYTGSEFLVAMILADGTLDASFSNDGFQLTLPGQAFAVAVQPDGKVLLAGRISVSGYDYIVTRYHTDMSMGLEEPLSSIAATILVHPSPFIHGATVQYDLLQQDRISIQLLDSDGRLVHQLLNDQLLSPGMHRIALDAPASLAPGAYVITIRGGSGAQRSLRVVKQ